MCITHIYLKYFIVTAISIRRARLPLFFIVVSKPAKLNIFNF